MRSSPIYGPIKPILPEYYREVRTVKMAKSVDKKKEPIRYRRELWNEYVEPIFSELDERERSHLNPARVFGPYSDVSVFRIYQMIRSVVEDKNIDIDDKITVLEMLTSFLNKHKDDYYHQRKLVATSLAKSIGSKELDEIFFRADRVEFETITSLLEDAGHEIVNIVNTDGSKQTISVIDWLNKKRSERRARQEANQQEGMGDRIIRITREEQERAQNVKKEKKDEFFRGLDQVKDRLRLEGGDETKFNNALQSLKESIDKYHPYDRWQPDTENAVNDLKEFFLRLRGEDFNELLNHIERHIQDGNPYQKELAIKFTRSLGKSLAEIVYKRYDSVENAKLANTALERLNLLNEKIVHKYDLPLYFDAGIHVNPKITGVSPTLDSLLTILYRPKGGEDVTKALKALEDYMQADIRSKGKLEPTELKEIFEWMNRYNDGVRNGIQEVFANVLRLLNDGEEKKNILNTWLKVIEENYKLGSGLPGNNDHIARPVRDLYTFLRTELDRISRRPQDQQQGSSRDQGHGPAVAIDNDQVREGQREIAAVGNQEINRHGRMMAADNRLPVGPVAAPRPQQQPVPDLGIAGRVIPQPQEKRDRDIGPVATFQPLQEVPALALHTPPIQPIQPIQPQLPPNYYATTTYGHARATGGFSPSSTVPTSHLNPRGRSQFSWLYPNSNFV